MSPRIYKTPDPLLDIVVPYEIVREPANVQYIWICEFEDCHADATSEWQHIDEDNNLYYSLRCSNHTITDPNYEKKRL